MSTLKYQKSMLKLYEELVRNPFKEFIIEELIKKTGVGRASGFEALGWLGQKGIIGINSIGKQKNIKLNIDNNSLNFKFFIDSLLLKEISPEIRFITNLFVHIATTKVEEIETIILFGSSIYDSNPNDIDLFIVSENKAAILAIRDKIQKISNYIINLHFTDNPLISDLFKGIVVYHKNSYTSLVKKRVKTRYDALKCQYEEILSDLESLLNNINEDSTVKEIIERLSRNLAYCYCSLNNIETKTKDETIDILMKHYSKRLKNITRIENIKKFEVFKEIANELGQKIFI